MTKSQLIARMCEAHPHLFQKQIERIVDAVFETISHALASGQRVELREFGNFTVRTRHPRKGRNPRSGQDVQVPTKQVPFFKAGREIRLKLNPPATGGSND